MSSPTARTKQFLERLGWEVGTVERYNSFIKRKFDLFNFIDLVCMAYPHPPCGLVAVQTTSGSNHAARRSKITGEPKIAESAKRWLKCGGHIWIISWTKRKKPAKWQPRIEIITEDLFHAEPLGDLAASK